MINSNINRVVSNLGDLKMVRFGLDSNISCGYIPILNSENLFDILYGELGIYPGTIYRISLVFTCSDNSSILKKNLLSLTQLIYLVKNLGISLMNYTIL
jgi:hypothetical protein